jgi:hypothetical protein
MALGSLQDRTQTVLISPLPQVGAFTLTKNLTAPGIVDGLRACFEPNEVFHAQAHFKP